MKMFASDNNSGVHPNIIKAIEMESKRYDFPYGEDSTTKKAKEVIIDLLGKDADIYFTTTGTSANIIGLSGLLRPFEAVVAAESAHINQDECNALERFNGSKIITVKSSNGKIKAEDIEPVLEIVGDRHSSQPKIISISQISETGTIYSVDEIKDLADFAHENDMYLHVDGARIANALEVLDVTLKEMISDTGVDLFSFGGTKNGMMIGEAIVSFVDQGRLSHKYAIKQGMQLLSKMRFISAQFIAYLEDDLWLKNAKQANEMGRYLGRELLKLDGISLVDYNDTNNLFIKMSKDKIDRLSEELYFYTIDEDEGIIRLITSYDMEKEDIDGIIDILKKY